MLQTTESADGFFKNSIGLAECEADQCASILRVHIERAWGNASNADLFDQMLAEGFGGRVPEGRVVTHDKVGACRSAHLQADLCKSVAEKIATMQIVLPQRGVVVIAHV